MFSIEVHTHPYTIKKRSNLHSKTKYTHPAHRGNEVIYCYNNDCVLGETHHLRAYCKTNSDID